MNFFYIFFLYSTYRHVATATSEPFNRKNLIFVYDVINPGIEYENFVQGVVEIYYEFFEAKRIFNKILVVLPFQTSIETITFDHNTNIDISVEEYLLREKPWIEAEKTESEESRVLAGLWAALHNGEPNSLVYVITNAKPENRPMMHSIQCHIDNKMIEVGFIIQQDFKQYEIPDEYREISIRSNGLILNVYSDSQIMTFLPDLLTTTINKVNLLIIGNHPKKCHTILVDEYLEEITITSWTSGGSEQYIINRFNHSEHWWIETHNLHRTRFLCAMKTNVVSYEGIPSGDLFIHVDTNSYLFDLRVFGVSAFNFNYGFSIDEVAINCGNKMLNRPIMNTQNYIYISSTNEQYDAVFTSCVILAIDNSFVREIPLQRFASNSNRNLYFGTFVPTSEAFYLRVTASINGKIVHRMSSFAISPFRKQTPEYESHDIEFSTDYTNTTYYGNIRPKRQIIKFI